MLKHLNLLSEHKIKRRKLTFHKEKRILREDKSSSISCSSITVSLARMRFLYLHNDEIQDLMQGSFKY